MSTLILTPEATAEVDGAPSTLARGSIVLDSGAVPYATATVTMTITDDDVVDALNALDDIRVPLEVAPKTGETLRPFDLGLRRRVLDPRTRQVTLYLASDEAQCQEYRLLEEDTTPYSLAGSLRDVVDYVLDTVIPGTSLEPGDDIDVTPHWDSVNMLVNPIFTTGITGYGGGAGASALTFVNFGGNGALRWTAAAGVSNLICAPSLTTFRATPGKAYTFTISLRSSVARTAQLALQWRNNGGAAAMATAYGSPAATTTSGFTTYTVTAVAPPGAEYFQPLVLTYGNTSGDFHYVDEGILSDGRWFIAPFSGATTDTADYLYEWSDTDSPNASSSSRTAINPRDPESLVWRAGQTAWDFLQPITASVGMVLYCDELRKWHLVLPEDRTLPTQINVSPSTTKDATDTLSREDIEANLTGIIIRFRWTDRDGLTHERVDTAGTPGRVLEVEIRSPYVPGIAAATLARRQGGGRVQDVTVVTRQEATPGMSVLIDLPGAPNTFGRITAVEFYLHTGYMRLSSTGLVDITPGDWALLGDDLDWSDFDTDTDWSDL